MSDIDQPQPLTPADIEAIVKRVQEGDTEPFRRLVLHFQRRLHVYCRHLLGGEAEAEDAVQDVFLKCYRGLRGYSPSVSFSAWLYRIAYRHCLNVMKKRKTERRLFSWLTAALPSASSPLEPRDLLEELLAPLSVWERNLIVLRAVEERSYRAISEIMGASPELLRKKYERLRKKMARRQPAKGNDERCEPALGATMSGSGE